MDLQVLHASMASEFKSAVFLLIRNRIIFSFNFRWSPETLPRCEVEYHPKMAWLSKRSVAEKVIRIPKRAKRSLRRRQRSSSSSGGGSSNFYGNQKVATTMPNSKL